MIPLGQRYFQRGQGTRWQSATRCMNFFLPLGLLWNALAESATDPIFTRTTASFSGSASSSCQPAIQSTRIHIQQRKNERKRVVIPNVTFSHFFTEKEGLQDSLQKISFTIEQTIPPIFIHATEGFPVMTKDFPQRICRKRDSKAISILKNPFCQFS